jgi:MFS family permease
MDSKTAMTSKDTYKKVLLKIYIYKLFAWFHMFSAVLIPFFTGWAKLSIFQITVLESWCMLCMLIFEIPSGAVADYLSRKRTLQIGLGIQALGFAVYVSMPNFYIYLLGEALIALGFSFISGTEEAFIYDTLKGFDRESESKKVFGRAESMGLAGIMIGAPIGSVIAQKFGLQYPMLLMFIPLTAAFFMLCLLREPMAAERKKENRSYFKILKNGVAVFYRHKTLKILAADLVVISTMGFLMLWLYQMMLSETGVKILFFGLVNTAIVVFEIILLNIYGSFEKLLGSKKRLLFASGMIIGTMYVISGFIKFVPVMIIAILSIGGFAMTRRPLLISYMNKYIKSEERATTISSISMLVSLSKMIAFPLIGFTIEKISLQAALIILGIITIVFTLLSKVEEKHLID